LQSICLRALIENYISTAGLCRKNTQLQTPSQRLFSVMFRKISPNLELQARKALADILVGAVEDVKKRLAEKR